jgi:hypothetical protein
MRITADLDRDVRTAIERMCREEGIGLSDALNRLIRTGLQHVSEGRAPRMPFVRQTIRVGVRIGVSCVAEALTNLEAC